MTKSSGERPRKLIPIGRTDSLSDEQLAYVQCYDIAMRRIPSGDRTAHNTQVLADRIWSIGR